MQRLLLYLLLLGATVNLAAGARRPAVERAILSQDHYAHADRAAAAVSQFVPKDAPLAVVGYDQDLVGELDAAVWFDYRAKWLLYPRDVRSYRVAPDDPLLLRAPPGEPSPAVGARADYLTQPYVLFFRVTAPPNLPPASLTILARDSMWVLARSGGDARARTVPNK
jgi:hypothetical protein